MNKSKILLRFFLIFFFFCFSCNAQQIITDNTAYFDKIESQIKSEDIKTLDTEKIDSYKQDLRILQKNIQDTINALEEEKKSQKQHLDALGPAPDKEKGEAESEQVSQIRKKINEDIIALDGKIKKEQLEIVRSDDLLTSLSNIRQEKLQSQLTERIPSPFMPNTLLMASSEGITFIQNMYNAPLTIGLIIIILLLNLISFPLLRLLKKKTTRIYKNQSWIYSSSFDCAAYFFISYYCCLAF